MMKNYQLEKDMKVFYVTATSFPDGIAEAFNRLEKKLPVKKGRIFFGISNPNEEGVIVYRAGVLQNFEGEGAQYGCKTFIINKGEYQTKTLKNWVNNNDTIRHTFDQLLKNPRLDTRSSCIEWYNNSDVMCMVKLKDPAV